MQLVLVEELVETVGARVVLLILPMHDVDVIDEFGEEVLHAFGRRCEFHDLVEGAIRLRLRDLAMDLEILLEALQGRRWIEILTMQPVQLFVNILLREYKDLELFAFDQVGAFSYLFNEHGEKVASLLQKVVTIIAETLLLGERGDVQTWKTLNEAVP